MPAPSVALTPFAELTSLHQEIGKAAASGDASAVSRSFFDNSLLAAPEQASLPPDAGGPGAPPLKSRLQAVQLLPSSGEALKAGLLDYIEVLSVAVETHRWPEVEETAGAQLSMLVGMLEFLKTALAKEISPCKKCVSKQSCAKVNSGKACPGCLGGVDMSFEQTEAALQEANALVEELKAPTAAGLRRRAEAIARWAAEKSS